MAHEEGKGMDNFGYVGDLLGLFQRFHELYRVLLLQNRKVQYLSS